MVIHCPDEVALQKFRRQISSVMDQEGGRFSRATRGQRKDLQKASSAIAKLKELRQSGMSRIEQFEVGDWS